MNITPHLYGLSKRRIYLIVLCLGIGSLLLSNKILSTTKGKKSVKTFESPPLISSSKASSEDYHAFVCIVGTLEDLELENKFDYALQPMANDSFNIHLQIHVQSSEAKDSRFVPPFREPYSFTKQSRYFQGMYNNTRLTTSASRFNNHPLFGGDNTETNTNFDTQEQIEQYLHQKNITLSSLNVRIYNPLINPPVNLLYFWVLALRDGFENVPKFKISGVTFGRIVGRIVNDVRYLESLGRCWNGFQNDLQTIRFTNRNNTVIFVRMGDDTLLSKKLNVADITKPFLTDQNNPIMVLPCVTARGHDSDQLEVFPLSVAEKAFTIPYAAFYQTGIFSKKLNTLSEYLYSIYDILLQESQTLVIAGASTDQKVAGMLPLPRNGQNITWGPLLSNKTLIGESLYPLNMAKFIVSNKTNFTLLAHDAKSQPRAFICITGQLQRLELENKVKNLIRPLQQAGYKVDLAFALSTGETSSQRRKEKKRFFFNNPKEVEIFLDENGGGDVLGNITYPKLSNPPVNPQYFIQKVGGRHFPQLTTYRNRFQFEDAIGRGFANTAMVESYTRCWKTVLERRRYYDLYIRIRDDAGLSKPINATVFTNVGSSDIWTSNRRTNGGINDRLAFIGSQAAECYFNLPYVRFFDGSYLDVGMRNTESYFKRIYWKAGCGDHQTIDVDVTKIV